MALTWRPTNGNFADTLYRTLESLEAPTTALRWKLHPVVTPTIGIGFDLLKASKDERQEVFLGLGFINAKSIWPGKTITANTPDAKEQLYIQKLLNLIAASNTTQADYDAVMLQRANETDAAYIAAYPIRRSTFTFANDAEVRSVFDAVWPFYEKAIFNLLPTLVSDAAFKSSKEYIAVAGSIYLGTFGRKAATALAAGNRANAWYELRYGWLDNDSRYNPGWAKRHYFESATLGLYDDPSNAVATRDEAKLTYQMLTVNRAEILRKEFLYGDHPDGTANNNSRISLARTDYQATLTAMGSNNPQSLVDSLTPAYTAFITWANTLLGAGAPNIDTAVISNPASIYFNGDQFTQTLDARGDDARSGNRLNNNLIIGGSGNDTEYGGQGVDYLVGLSGADTLDGGGGDDILMGGTGEDIYIWRDGDGTDTIIDPDGGRLVIVTDGGASFSGGMMIQQGTSNIWKDASGTFTLSHNSPWQLQLPDGSIIKLGVDFDPTKWHINLDANDTPVNPASDTGLALYTLDPLSEGSIFSLRADATPDAFLNGVQAYTDLTPISHWIIADDDGGRSPDDGGEVITLGDGDDYVDVGRRNTYGAHWAPGVGQDEDFVSTGGGNDIIMTGYGSDTISGGAGNDQIYSALIGGYQIHTSADSVSSDMVDGGDGNDQIWGGMGSDFVFGDDGYDQVLGMEGNDFISGGDSDDALNGDGAYVTSAAYLDYYIGALLGYTTGGDDTLWGDAGNDRLVGGVGKDYLDGGTGNDNLFGDTDSYYTEGNVAWIPGQYHNDDFLDGGEGDDFLIGGGGTDLLFGGAGDDNLYGDQYDYPNVPGLSAIAIAYQGNDLLDGGAGYDNLFGGGGNDVLIGGADYDTLNGGLGDDVYRFNEGDLVDGGTEMITDSGGTDRIEFASGLTASDARVMRYNKDLFIKFGDGTGIGIANVFADGVAIVESVSFSDGTILSYSDLLIAAVLTTEGDDTVQTIAANSTIDGGAGNDALYGDVWSDTLLGGDGFDRLYGGGGSDVLDGGAGDDALYAGGTETVLIGGAGRDSLRDTSSTDTTYRINLGDGEDYIEETGGVDTIEFGAGISPEDVVLRNTRFNLGIALPDGGYVGVIDMFSGGGTVRIDNRSIEFIKFADGTIWDQQKIMSQTLVSTAGNDVIYVAQSDSLVDAGDGDDQVYGGNGNDSLYGGDGNDTLYGGFGDDLIFGGAGDDELQGTQGNNVLIGGTGDDRLDASVGSNVLRFDAGFGQDVVWLGQGITTLEFGLGISPTDATIRMDGYGSIKMTFSSGDSLYLQWVANTTTGAMYRSFPTTTFADGTVWTASNFKALAVTGSSSADSLYGFDSADAIVGAAGDDRLYGLNGDDVLNGGLGVDTLDGGAGNDVYLFSRGDGQDVIREGTADSTAGKRNVLRFASSISVADISVRQSGADLRVFVSGTTDQILISSFYANNDPGNSRNPVQVFEFPDGATWDIAKIDLLAKANVNHAPQVATALVNKTTNENSPWSFTVPSSTFVDSDVGDVLAYTAYTADGFYLPSWIGFDPGTRTFSGTPLSTDVGTMSVKVFATDLDGASASSTFNLTVANINEAPVLLSGVTAQVAELSSISTVVYKALASDVDAGDTLSYSLSGADASAFNIVASTGNVTLKAVANYEAKPTYSFNVIVTDTGGLIAIQAVALNITNVNEAPTTAARTVTTIEDTAYVFKLADFAFTDVDAGDALSKIGISTLPSTGSLKLNGVAVTANLNVTVMQINAGQLVYTPAVNANGTISSFNYQVKDTAGLASSNALMSVNATAKNDSPTGAVTLSGTATQNQILTASRTLADVDGIGTVSYQWQVSADGTNWLAIAGAASTTFKLQEAQVGKTVRIVVSYTDSGGTVESVASAASTPIVNVNDVPGGLVAIAGAAKQNQILTASNTLTDADGLGVISYQWQSSTDGATWTSISGATTNTFTLSAAQVGKIVRVIGSYTDGHGKAETVTSSVTSTISTDINRVVGTAGADTLAGTTGVDQLEGLAGNDTYVVNNAGDIVVEASGAGTELVQSSVTYSLTANVENLTLTGTAAVNGTGNTLSNTLTGNSGNNTLDGGAGADTMIGGGGNDTYMVENTGDVVTEAANAGTDTVQSFVSWTLGTNLENLVLLGTAAINGTGNTAANTITGNSANNILNGGAGNDTLIGGAGNDTYVVDSASDVVTEALNAGTDLVQASVTYTLGANVENLTLTWTSAINATGNTLDNVLTGNSAANVLTGGTGDDTYVVGTGDTTIEAASAGTDTVQSTITWTLATNVENLTLTGTSAINATGNTLNNVLRGNTGNNTLTGNAGNDTLDGGAGTDILVGGVGNDTYKLGRGYGADTITENDATSGNTDVALFDAGISMDQLWFLKSGNNLEVRIIGTTDKFTLTNWYLGNQYHVEQFKTSDGKLLLDSQVQNLVNAMAAFAPPPAGQTTLNAAQAASLSPVIAANWQ